MPIAPLVATDDTDLVGWQAGDQETFLGMAADMVRKYCGWHIAPELPVVDRKVYLGERGLAMLTSTHVTAVSGVSLLGQELTADCEYTWQEPKPWIRLHPNRIPGPWPHANPHVLVSYTHGYSECPSDAKAVIFEVMATAMELPASNADRIATMQYNLVLRPDTGIALSDRQKDRLSQYKVTRFGAR